MTYNLQRAVADPAFWTFLRTALGDDLIQNGWIGSLDEPDLSEPDNHDLLYDALMNEVSICGTQVTCEDWEGGGIPGSAGATWIHELGGKYFVTSSDYDPGGPYDSLAEAREHPAFNDF